MRFTDAEQDLIRWCYVVAGMSRSKLARDFECTVDDIQAVVSSGLSDVLLPRKSKRRASSKPKLPVRKIQSADLPPLNLLARLRGILA
jgi:hypothetical protein